ncbi:transposable element Tcb1 transposase [Trichonephila clavipes]|nr:transposable element Tcb1 transposase [Trichonephila clavipes]
MFCLQYQEGRIRVRLHRGESTLATCIHHRHTSPSSGMMLWGGIGYMSRLPLVRIDGTLNNARLISGVLRPMALYFIRALRNPTFQQDNARRMLPVLHGPSLIRKMFNCCPGFALSLDLWSMAAQRLARHHTLVTTVDELWHRVEAAWTFVPVHTIQSLFDSIPRGISGVIIARGGCSGY